MFSPDLFEKSPRPLVCFLSCQCTCLYTTYHDFYVKFKYLLGAERVKRGWIQQCLKDCDDLPQGQKAPCRADCVRGKKDKTD